MATNRVNNVHGGLSPPPVLSWVRTCYGQWSGMQRPIDDPDRDARMRALSAERPVRRRAEGAVAATLLQEFHF